MRPGSQLYLVQALIKLQTWENWPSNSQEVAPDRFACFFRASGWSNPLGLLAAPASPVRSDEMLQGEGLLHFSKQHREFTCSGRVPPLNASGKDASWPRDSQNPSCSFQANMPTKTVTTCDLHGLIRCKRCDSIQSFSTWTGLPDFRILSSDLGPFNFKGARSSIASSTKLVKPISRETFFWEHLLIKPLPKQSCDVDNHIERWTPHTPFF